MPTPSPRSPILGDTRRRRRPDRSLRFSERSSSPPGPSGSRGDGDGSARESVDDGETKKSFPAVLARRRSRVAGWVGLRAVRWLSDEGMIAPRNAGSAKGNGTRCRESSELAHEIEAGDGALGGPLGA